MLLNNNFHIKQYVNPALNSNFYIPRHSLRVHLDIYPSEAEVFRGLQRRTSLAAVQFTDDLKSLRHQLLTADGLKHLSPLLLYWLHFVVNFGRTKAFGPKNRITACCSFLDANSGTLVMFIVYWMCS